MEDLENINIEKYDSYYLLILFIIFSPIILVSFIFLILILPIWTPVVILYDKIVEYYEHSKRIN